VSDRLFYALMALGLACMAWYIFALVWALSQ
jgi:hypothetical protein